MALYNKMRPRNLNEVKGQDKVVKILLKNLQSNNLPNAMLFVGTHGTGKTSIAKIVARRVNCEHPGEDGSCCNECASCQSILAGNSLDVMELDAASNNGVDNIRSIIEAVQFKPIGKMKVVILDEVHMLSPGAFNALLKTMEEPPADVLFILCTTELHKVPSTIVSRCRKFQFASISIEAIIEKLQEINEIYQKTAEDEALMIIAKAANGSMRDAESIYDSFMDVDGVITAELVRDTLGFTSEENVFSILDSISQRNPMLASAVIDDIAERGGSLVFLLEDCFRVLMDIISINLGGDISSLAGSEKYVSKITESAFSFETQRLFEIVGAFRKAYEQKSANLSMALQATVVGLVCEQSSIEDLTKRVKDLEDALNEIKANGLVSAEPPTVSYMPVDVNDDVVAGNDSAVMSTQDEFPSDSEFAPCEVDFDSISDSMLEAYSAMANDATSQCSNIETPDRATEPMSDADLIGYGFQLSNEAPVFEEEVLDDSMLEPSSQFIVPESTSEQKASSTIKSTVKEPSATNSSYNFFGDFARHFQ